MRLKYLFCTLFVVIIFLPTVLLPFYKANTEGENRKLASFPRYQGYPVGYITQLENYYNDNFAFRDKLQKIYQFYSFKLLNHNPLPDKVVVGKDGWLFMGESEQESMTQALNIIPDLEQQIDNACSTLFNLKQFCDSLGIGFYIAIAPNKESIYPEYYPIKIKSPGNTLEMFTRIMKTKYKIDIINLGESFYTEKAKTQLYSKTDSHWNSDGAYLATQTLLRTLSADFPAIQSLDISEYYRRDTTATRMDLSSMLQLDMQEDFNLLVPSKKEYNIELKQIESIDWPPPVYQFVKNDSESCVKLKSVVIRDSFWKLMQDFYFSRMSEVIVGTRKFDKELIIKEKPDFVVYEILERRIPSLDINANN